MFKKNKASNRISTLQWVQQWKSEQVQHKTVVERLEKHFDDTYQTCRNNNKDTLEPINIICLDGGGSKGVAHLSMLEALSQKADQNILQHFDLVGGSSVGGVTALTCNFCDGDLAEISRVSYKTANTISQGPFKKFKLWNLLTKGYLESKKDTMSNVFYDTVADAPLYNPNSMKVFALSTRRSPNQEEVFEPYVFRTYDIAETVEESESFLQPVPGTNEVMLWEAATATSAAPVLTNRIEIKANEQINRCADGSVISNSPVAFAINEAKCIWPNRPIGAILSIGLGGSDGEEELIQRSVAAAKKCDPKLYFLRLEPPVLENYSFAETCPKVIDQMKDDVRSYVLNESTDVNQLLDVLQKQSRTLTTKTRSSSRKSVRNSWFMRLRNMDDARKHLRLRLGNIISVTKCDSGRSRLSGHSHLGQSRISEIE